MGQRQHHANTGTDDSAWLTTLVDAFERTEQLGDLPCDAQAVSAATSRLQSPAAPCTSTVQRRRKAVFEVQH